MKVSLSKNGFPVIEVESQFELEALWGILDDMYEYGSEDLRLKLLKSIGGMMSNRNA